MKKADSIFTTSVHAGMDRRSHHGAASVPIYNASVFAFEDAAEGAAVHNYEKHGYFYGRLGNPTQEALEKAVAALEHGEDAIALASGMAAISSALMSVIRSGDHLIAPESMYSTSNSLFHYLSDNFGLEISYVNAKNPANYQAAIKDTTRVIWIETPSNPLLNITEIEAVTEFARAQEIITIADNTFATPFNQRPLRLGVDLSIHSATKYLGGHSDLTAGVVAGSSEFIERIRHSTNKYFGGNIAPQVAWLVLRGIKTLALRMRQHNENASFIADSLSSHPKVKEVFYPGLETHSNHEVAKKQMRGFGGMVSFDLGGFEEGKAFMNGLDLISIATSLGGVESIAQHSASMTHAVLSKEERKTAGISEGLIRLSVGIEDKGDIEKDILSALERL
ncbi:MAG: PLP-dependent aspartate aminotransferase family protein [Acidobacteriota bacterium]|nr:PLP-dependent aspartate aminotransferase family protein [Acidobacteriota bacterium]MDH3528211.1 PLP-dependent aspartate aminotransferase family protein [Acidobacteriota bacterium]